MIKRTANGIGLRREMEARTPAIGLNASGSYVLSSFDVAEFAYVQSVDFNKLVFSKDEVVVVARGTSGSLARFAKVTSDQQHARYLGGKFISLALIDGQVFSKADFIRSVAGNPTLRVMIVQNCKELVGVLCGDMAKRYKTLVYSVGDRFNLLDLEENPPSHVSGMQVRIIETNPAEGMAAKADLLKRFS